MIQRRKDGTLSKYPITDEFLDFLRQNLSLSNKKLLALVRENEEWRWCTMGSLTCIKNRYLTMGDVEMAQILGRKFKSLHKFRRVTLNLRRDKENLAALMKQVAKKGHAGRAQKMAEGTFYNARYRLQGEIYRNRCSGNYWLIKPTSDKLLHPIYLHRYIWEQVYGPVKKGYKVRFINGIIPDDPPSV